ncbi:MAG: AsmA family protein [Proteobacteria bacterium]|nr:AsmA family protein [Pseudomonadota bacterium]
MLKKILLTFCILVALLIAAAIYLARNANSLVARYKPELEAIASKTLGAPVSFGELSVSVLPSTTLAVTNTVLGKTAASAGVKLDRMELSLGLAKLLTGVLEIKALRVLSPKILLEKSESGTTVRGFPAAPRATSEGAPAPAQSPPTGNASPGAPLAIALEHFSVEDGVLAVQDSSGKSIATIQKLSIESAVTIGTESLEIPSLNLSGEINGAPPFGVSATSIVYGVRSGALMAKSVTISCLENRIELVPSLNIKNLAGTISLNSSGIDLEALQPLLKTLSPQIDPMRLRGRVVPALKSSIDSISGKPTIGVNGSIRLSGLGLDSGGVSFRDLVGAVEVTSKAGIASVNSPKISGTANGEPFELAVKGSLAQPSGQLNIETLELRGFGGETKSKVQAVISSPQSFSIDIDSKEHELAKLLRLSTQGNSLGVSGVLSTVRVQVRGQPGPVLQNSLQGGVRLGLRDGALVGTNIIGNVVRQLASLPVLNPEFLSGLDPKTRAALDSKDTSIKSLTGDFVIASGVMSTSNLQLVSAFFSLNGSGRIGLDGSVDLNTSIALTPELSATIVRGSKGLSKALDGSQRLVIPLRVTGKAPALRVLPNTEKLLGMAAEKAIEKGLQGLLKGSGEGKKNGLGGFLDRIK